MDENVKCEIDLLIEKVRCSDVYMEYILLLEKVNNSILIKDLLYLQN